jgi:hypothetical protein
MTQPHLYDAGALIAIDKNDRRIWARYQVAVDDGRDIRVPAVVVGQAWRDSRRQVRLGKFLAGWRVDPAGPETAKAAGIPCGRAGTSDLTGDAPGRECTHPYRRQHLPFRPRSPAGTPRLPWPARRTGGRMAG